MQVPYLSQIKYIGLPVIFNSNTINYEVQTILAYVKVNCNSGKIMVEMVNENQDGASHFGG